MLDFAGNRRREEKRLTLLREAADDLPDVGEEAHVQHTVRLVKDEHLEVAKVDVSPPDMVQQSSGCRHDHVHPVSESSFLELHSYSSIDGFSPDPCSYCKVFQHRFRLERQFPGW